MAIKMVDLYGPYERIREEVEAGLREVVASSAFINGPAVGEFARELSQYLGVRHTIPCGNGTDALLLALMAIGLKAGDEVIVPAFSYAAPAEAVALLGGVPVMADVEADTFNIAPQSVRRLVTPRTRAIVPVHLFGQVCAMEPVLEIAREYGLYVIEDNAQSLGAVYTFPDGRRRCAGTIGHIGCTSFFPTKVLGCFGDGGALFTDDDSLAERLRMLAQHGQRERYRHEMVGFNSRLDSVQAVVLRAKLARLGESIAARAAAARRYSLRLGAVEGVCVPAEAAYSTHVWHQYTLTVEEGVRDALRARLAQEGIPSAVYYPLPLPEQPAYRGLCVADRRLEAALRLPRRVLSLPIHTELTAAQQEEIIGAVERFFER